MRNRGESTVKSVRVVLEGVPRISFLPHEGKVELTPFPSSLEACLEFVGEEYTYEYLMGSSGAAFRLLWKPGWHIDNVGLSFMAEDTLEPFRRAFEAIGRTPEVVAKEEGSDSEAYFRMHIIESIHDWGRPVLGFGVVGPPECSIIAGYV